MLIRQHIERGFTLVELLIGMALIAILSTLAVPAFQHWVQNMQIRTAAEGALNGLQLARAEAVRRNVKVELVLGAGASWTVSTVVTPTLVQERVAEGSDNTTLTIAPVGASKITFNGMGWVDKTNADGSNAIAQIDVASATMAGTEIRPLRVVITTGGATKMCDPAVSAPDPRACP